MGDHAPGDTRVTERIVIGAGEVAEPWKAGHQWPEEGGKKSGVPGTTQPRMGTLPRVEMRQRLGRQGRCVEVRAGGASAQGRPAEGAWVRPNGTSPHSQSSTGAKWGPCGQIKLYVSLRVRSASQRWGCVEGMSGRSCVVGCRGAGLGQSIGRPVGVACGCWVCP